MPRHQRQAAGSQRSYAHDLSIPTDAPHMYPSGPRVDLPGGDPYFIDPAGAGEPTGIPVPPQAPNSQYYGSTSMPPVAPTTQHRASSGAWSPQDDQQLVQARTQGLNWGQIKDRYFPTKTGNACRKRHERLMERKGADDLDNRRIEKIAQEYMIMRKEIWQGLAARTGEKWSVVEQKCLSNGLKNLQSHARAASRRYRAGSSASGAPFSGYDDDSGISGIGLTPVDELDASYSSPETTISSGGHSSISSTTGGYAHAPLPHPPAPSRAPQASVPSYPYHSHSRSATSQLQPPIQTINAGYHMNGYNAGYVPSHGYSSSVSSSASAYGTGPGANHGGSSPYMRG